jgi:hypothetical protein
VGDRAAMMTRRCSYDLMEYRRRQRIQVELASADMVANRATGLYDADPAEVKAALKAARRKAED